MVINCIARAINQTASYIKTARGIARVLAVIRRTFSGTYLFNRALGG